MAGKKSEQIKLVVVFVLALVLAVVVYVRFAQKKGAETTSEGTQPGRFVSLEVPEVALDERETVGWREAPGGLPIREPLRDIFVPGAVRPEEAGEFTGEEGSVSIASLRLRGVVAGGARPVALINDRFVRLGDRLYQYQVASIGAKEVWLASGMETFQLRILKEN